MISGEIERVWQTPSATPAQSHLMVCAGGELGWSGLLLDVDDTALNEFREPVFAVCAADAGLLPA